MRVLFDCKGFLRPFGGIYEYARHLIGNLRELGVEPILHCPAEKLPEDWRNEVETVPLHMFKGWRRIGADRVQTDWAIRKSGADLFHSLSYTAPFRTRVPVVMTCHDFIHERFPQQFVGGKQERFAKTKQGIIRRSDVLLCVSENTRKDARDFVPGYAGVMRVVHNGVDPEFFERNPDAVAARKQQYGLTRPYWVYSGPRHGYKNFETLYQAYGEGGFADRIDLVSFGCQADLTDKDLATWASGCTQPPPGVKLLGFLPAEDRLRILQGAQAMVYPSEYEGFGIPVLEAMASGVPVMCGRNASIPEVAGEEAVYVDVLDAASIGTGLHQLLDGDHQMLTARALERARGFSWRRCAEETLQIYEEALNV